MAFGARTEGVSVISREDKRYGATGTLKLPRVN
jgi:hypothetical protein